MTHDQAEALREALEPFATFAEGNVDEHGWTGIAVKNDRIVCWFGPSDFRRAAEAFAALASPAPAGGEADNPKALAIFTEYFVKNYPGPDTIIHKPQWHAPKIFRAAQHAIAQAAPVTPPPSPDVAGVVERLRTAHDHVERLSYADTAALAYDALAVIESLSAEKGRLEEALRPFAKFADALNEDAPDNIALGLFADGALRFGPDCPSIGDLRRARALTPKDGSR